MTHLVQVAVRAELGTSGRSVLMSLGQTILPHRLELGLVDHQEAHEHEEASQHHGRGHALRLVILGVELASLGGYFQLSRGISFSG